MWGEWSSNSIFPGNISGTSYGTSVSNQIIAAKYVALKAAKPDLSLTELITLMKSSYVPVSNLVSQKVYLFDLRKAING